MLQEVCVDDQAWDDPLPSSVIVAVVVAQPADLLRENYLSGLGVAPRAAFVRDTRALEPPREQVYDRVVELLDAVVLCARHGFEEVAIDIDAERRILGVVCDGAPSDGQAAALGHAKFVLNRGSELACR